MDPAVQDVRKKAACYVESLVKDCNSIAALFDVQELAPERMDPVSCLQTALDSWVAQSKLEASFQDSLDVWIAGTGSSQHASSSDGLPPASPSIDVIEKAMYSLSFEKASHSLKSYPAGEVTNCETSRFCDTVKVRHDAMIKPQHTPPPSTHASRLNQIAAHLPMTLPSPSYSSKTKIADARSDHRSAPSTQKAATKQHTTDSQRMAATAPSHKPKAAAQHLAGLRAQIEDRLRTKTNSHKASTPQKQSRTSNVRSAVKAESRFDKWKREGPNVADSNADADVHPDFFSRSCTSAAFRKDFQAIFKDDDQETSTWSDAVDSPTRRRAGWQLRQRAFAMQIPMDDVLFLKQVFDSFDVDRSGTLEFEEFESAVKRLMELSNVPLANVRSMSDWNHWEAGSKGVDFDEFLKWFSSNSFKEDLLLSQEQQELRKIGRQHGVDPECVEQAKKIFDSCTNNTQEANLSQFAPVLNKILKVPPGCEIPESRVRFFWAQIDADCSGTVAFPEFFDWWALYFGGEEGTSQTPYERFYAQVRRMGDDCLDPPAFHVSKKAAETSSEIDVGKEDGNCVSEDGKDEPVYVRLSELLLAAAAEKSSPQGSDGLAQDDSLSNLTELSEPNEASDASSDQE